MKDIFNKRQRFSIRKFSVGVASVLIGVALFTPSQGVLASTGNNLATEIGANAERGNSIPTVENKEEAQSSPENRGDISSPAPKDIPMISTRTTELETSGNKENNSLTTRTSVAGEDRSSTPAVRAASNPSEIKKYELTEEDAKKIKAGIIGSEGDKYDSLLLDGPELKPNDYTDEDYLSNKDEIYIYEKGGKKYVGYNSHPLLEDTDGDGIIDSKEKPDEKLKWNVSERDMIMFMELSYRNDDYIDKVLNHKKQLKEADLYKKNGDTKPRYEYMMMNRELAPYWKRKKSYHTSSGLDAVLFETKSDFPFLPNGTAQVLAFRGTSGGNDIVADAVLGTGSNPQQGKDAEEIMRELAKDNSITNLYLTGHSLGGYLVQRAMVEAYQLAYSDSRYLIPKEQLAYRNFYNNVLKKGTTFNAPKVVTSLVSGREFWQKGLDSKKIAKSGKMTHYIVDNDSTIRKGVSNDSDVVINVGPTSGGHSSRSYFEADMINRRSEFISGKRISLDETGYQDKKITTVKSLEKVGETAVYSKRGDDIIKSTTVSMKDPDTGQITKNTLDEVFKKDGAKAKVVVMPIEPSIRYEKDATRAKGEVKITSAGTLGTSTVTTTYTVNATDGSLIPHEEPAVVVPSKPTVVKVPAKDEVEYLKEVDDVAKKTTTYEVNESTGDLIPTVRQDIVSPNGVKSKVVTKIIPVTTRYEADKTKDVGNTTVTNNGSEGKIVTTTSTLVNETNGTVTDGTPVVSRTEMVPKVVKVGAKDKVLETPIEPEVEYIKDVEKDFGTPDQRTEGEKGKAVTTTTYDVDPKDGHITEHLGNPVVTPAGKTIVKVGAKTKVERSKDPEGREVINTTTYEVDPKTGKVTPITVRTDGKSKEAKVELEQDPKTGDDTATPKTQDGSIYAPGTKVEVPDEDGKGKVPNSDLPDVEKPGTGTTTNPGKPAVEVPNATTPPKVTIFENGVLPDSIELPELLIEVRWIGEDGNVLKPSLKTGNEKDAEHGSISGYEFVRTVIDENEPVMTHIFRKASGSTNPNTIPATLPKVTIFENGVLPDSIELSELMIEVRWIDEDGNVLKPSVKTGNEKDSEHGSISGYEFVRTVIDENEPVMTHIFRKASGSTNPNTIPVNPVTSDTNGNTGPDTSALTTPIPVAPVTADANGNPGQDTAAPTTSTPIPDSVTPNAKHENTTDTIDNGAKSNEFQNVLPNTGTESNATLASLGLLGLLSGFGLVVRKKKED